MTMIVVELAGGLGNQMFQYAAAQACARRLSRPLLLDLRSYERDSLRRFELWRWQLSAKVAGANDLWRFPRWGRAAARRLQALGLPIRSYYIEQNFRFDSRLFQRDGSMHLTGYFQSEQYFSDCRAELLQEFTPATAIPPESARIREMISNVSSTSVHVRRGDYADNPTTAAIHGVCEASYYDSAMRTVRDVKGPQTYFVFSDDMAWAKQHLRPPGEAVFVEGNQARPEVDIHLMSSCAHNICANSSFSWWGAWLNPRPDKVVVAPARWFASAARDASDLVPSSWLRVG
jgi:hypothetical protein